VAQLPALTPATVVAAPATAGDGAAVGGGDDGAFSAPKNSLASSLLCTSSCAIAWTGM
jgi:hypothetical protein